MLAKVREMAVTPAMIDLNISASFRFGCLLGGDEPKLGRVMLAKQ